VGWTYDVRFMFSDKLIRRKDFLVIG